MAKEAKTNAMRMLERKKISYEAFPYECDEFIDGIHSADLVGAPYEQSFKTLVMEGKSGGYYVFVVPIQKEVEQKSCGKGSWRKNSGHDPCKGYPEDHRLCKRRLQPLGMKKAYPTVFDSSAESFEEIYISGGRIGLTLKVPVKSLLEVTRGKTADITL